MLVNRAGKHLSLLKHSRARVDSALVKSDTRKLSQPCPDCVHYSRVRGRRGKLARIRGQASFVVGGALVRFSVY